MCVRESVWESVCGREIALCESVRERFCVRESVCVR
jgi:hypothetical protein